MADDYTEAELAAAEALEMPVEEVRRVIEAYLQGCRESAQRRREVTRKRLEAHGVTTLD